ncbi:MAG: hypothetical protein QM756_01275 [Polyangiaceae bacterium]
MFQSAHNALYNSDSGAPTWKFCATGYFGVLYAPTATGVEANQVDANSSINLGGQTATGEGLALPAHVSGNEYEVRVPISTSSSQAYRVTLDSDAAAATAAVQAEAGVGHLF